MQKKGALHVVPVAPHDSCYPHNEKEADVSSFGIWNIYWHTSRLLDTPQLYFFCVCVRWRLSWCCVLTCVTKPVKYPLIFCCLFYPVSVPQSFMLGRFTNNMKGAVCKAVVKHLICKLPIVFATAVVEQLLLRNKESPVRAKSSTNYTLS